VTSPVTGESRVIAFDSFDITAECDATVIRDEMPYCFDCPLKLLEKMLLGFSLRLEEF